MFSILRFVHLVCFLYCHFLICQVLFAVILVSVCCSLFKPNLICYVLAVILLLSPSTLTTIYPFLFHFFCVFLVLFTSSSLCFTIALFSFPLLLFLSCLLLQLGCFISAMYILIFSTHIMSLYSTFPSPCVSFFSAVPLSFLVTHHLVTFLFLVFSLHPVLPSFFFILDLLFPTIVCNFSYHIVTVNMLSPHARCQRHRFTLAFLWQGIKIDDVVKLLRWVNFFVSRERFTHGRCKKLTSCQKLCC